MKLFFDFFPIFIFFLGYKWFGIYNATAIAMAAALFQLLFYRFKHQRFEKMHLVSFGLIFVLGGATLFFHNPWFIKWKPTGIYWATSLVFLGSSLLSKKPLIQRIMEGNINLPQKVWCRLNFAWAMFFVLMGSVNLYVAYYYSTDIWVNFKLFGGAGFTLVFVFIQALYLTRHLIEKDLEQQPTSNSP